MFGYRPREVDAALSALEAAVAQRAAELAAALAQARTAQARVAELDLVADRLTERVLAGERELAAVRAQLERAHAASADAVRSLAALADELAEIRSQARGQATRIRMGALRDAAALSERIAGLLADPKLPSGALLGALSEALEAIGTENGAEQPDDGAERSEDGAEQPDDDADAALVPPEPGSEITVRAGSRTAADDRPEGAGSKPAPAAQPPGEPPAARSGASAPAFAPPHSGADVASAARVDSSLVRVAEDVFVGAVEIDVGPLSDFSQLVAFEDATAALPAVSEVVVTRFAQGRATLAIRLAEPAELVRELEAGVPFGFDVRSVGADRIELDVVGG